MGHVDHGKTRLLDAIRKTNVMAEEAGGITQHIGAYQVHVEHEGEDRPITFIDTPGHEAFTAMRARGAATTDIVVLVVAADDGVMPQTIEALNHAQAADVPIVVAVNKIDKEDANPAKVRQQLTEYGLVAEEYGGDTLFVDVSARVEPATSTACSRASCSPPTPRSTCGPTPTRTRRASSSRPAWTAAAGRSPPCSSSAARCNVGDSVVAGDAFGRVRAMLDENGDTVEVAGPSRPVQVLGLTSVPGAGDSFLVVDEDRDRPPDRRPALGARAQRAAGLHAVAGSRSTTWTRRWPRARCSSST